MKHVFIINPKAGGRKGNTSRILAMAEDLRRRHGLECTCMLTQSPGHARELSRRIAEGGEEFADFSVEDAADDAVGAAWSARDADAATSLGTAFHRLAQLAALAWRPGCAFERPDVARQRALERSCGLSAEQRDRLDAALERWFASDIAARVGVCESVSAEAPFLVRVGGPRDAAYLEGEIDLLACVAPAGTREQPAGSALVVDYKTGGSPAETAEQLHEKHLLQATCYAYAVLMEGYAQVECVFVRVEQARAGSETQPQTVSYRFDAADAPAIRAAIVQAYHECSQQRQTEGSLA